MSLTPTTGKSWELRPDRTKAGLSLFPVLGGWAPLSKKLGSPGDVQSPPKHIAFSLHETILRSFFLPGFVRIRTWFGSTPFRIVQKRSKHKRLTPLVKLTFFLPKLPRSFVWATKNRIHSLRLGAFTRGAETSLPQTLVETAVSAGSFLS